MTFDDMPISFCQILGLLVFFTVWAILIFLFPAFRIYTLTIPPILIVNFAKEQRLRDCFINYFVVIWLFLFFYYNTRSFLLEPFLRGAFRNPTLTLEGNKFLFPPAGPIMFYNVNSAFGHHRVLGIKNEEAFELDPHDIYLTRTFFYDNVHRGVLGEIGDLSNAPSFCYTMYRRMPEFDDFVVTLRVYPSLTTSRYVYREKLIYHCGKILPKVQAKP